MTCLIILFSRITIHEGKIYILDRLQVYEIHVKLINMIDDNNKTKNDRQQYYHSVIL